MEQTVAVMPRGCQQAAMVLRCSVVQTCFPSLETGDRLTLASSFVPLVQGESYVAAGHTQRQYCICFNKVQKSFCTKSFQVINREKADMTFLNTEYVLILFLLLVCTAAALPKPTYCCMQYAYVRNIAL